MWTRTAMAFGLACAVAACASQPPDAGLAGSASSDALKDEPYALKEEPLRPHRTAGEWAVAVAGTPFLWAFKGAACAGSLVVAAPVSAVAALGDHHTRKQGLAILGDGVGQNCGPPWVLSP